MGHDPASSVLDANGFAHEVPNLAVLGASAFPTTGGHNPTLTVQALAWRTATYRAARGRHAPAPRRPRVDAAVAAILGLIRSSY